MNGYDYELAGAFAWVVMYGSQPAECAADPPFARREPATPMLTTITRIIRADWGAALEAAARAVVPAIALAYVAGMALGRWIHDLNDALAAMASRRPAPAVAPAAPEPIAAALPPAGSAPLALLAPATVDLATLSNRELMQLVGTRRKLPKRQLIALAVGAA